MELEVHNRSFGVVPVRYPEPSHAEQLSQHSSYKLDLSKKEQKLIGIDGQSHMLLSYRPDLFFPMTVVRFRRYYCNKDEHTGDLTVCIESMILAHYSVTAGDTHYSIFNYYYVDGLLCPSIDNICRFDGSLDGHLECFDRLFADYAKGSFIDNGFIRNHLDWN
ncbi:hypothetical protein ACPV5Q_20195 [Vibrio astriarenae]